MANKAEKLKAFGSMKAAAAGLNIPIEELRWAKASGCPAFKWARVEVKALLKWRTDHPFGLVGQDDGAEALGSLKKKLIVQQMERNAFDLSKAKGEYVSRAELEFIIPKCLAHAIAIQRKHLPVELFNTICSETKLGFERILTEIGKSKGAHESTETASGV